MYFNDSRDEKFEIFKKLAEKNREKILFAHSSISTGIGEKLADYIGVT